MTFKARGIIPAALLTLGITSSLLLVVIAGIGTLLLPTTNYLVSRVSSNGVQLNQKDIVGKAAILFDPNTDKILFEKNANTSLPLASLTKLATAQTVLAETSKNLPITLTREQMLHQDEGDNNLHAGDSLPLSELLQLGLVASSNDAMAAAATSLGPNAIKKINTTAAKLGLRESVFYNPTGLDLNTSTAGAYGSAHDMAILASTFYRQHPQYFELTQRSTVTIKYGGRTISALATAAPLLSLPGLVGAKTGYTTLAGGNVVAIFEVEIGHPLVAVVLGSTEEGRFKDIRTLIAAARQSI